MMELFEQTVVLHIKHMASGQQSEPAGWSWPFLLQLHDPENVKVVVSSGHVLAMDYDSERVAACDRIRDMLDVMQGLVQEIRAEAFGHPDMGDVGLLVVQVENLVELAQNETYAAVEREVGAPE